jgi:hypothetical protein
MPIVKKLGSMREKFVIIPATSPRSQFIIREQGFWEQKPLIVSLALNLAFAVAMVWLRFFVYH